MNLSRTVVSVVATLSLGATLSTPGLAAEQPSPSPTPCVAPEHRQFDFWVGDWNVVDAQGKAEGTNNITVEMGGCIIQEHWTDADGKMIGTSFNLYYPPARRWYQTWVDNSGGFLQLSGGLEAGKMVLSGDMPSRAGGTVKHRLSFEKTGPDQGHVRQLWESSKDGGKSWNVVFDGTYVRKK